MTSSPPPSDASSVTAPSDPSSGHVPRVLVGELGSPCVEAQVASRSLRDAGHEVVYAGVLAAAPDLDRRLAAVCVQEDVDALVLFGDVPDSLLAQVRDRLGEGADDGGDGAEEGEVALLLDGPDLRERVEAAARRT